MKIKKLTILGITSFLLMSCGSGNKNESSNNASFSSSDTVSSLDNSNSSQNSTSSSASSSSTSSSSSSSASSSLSSSQEVDARAAILEIILNPSFAAKGSYTVGGVKHDLEMVITENTYYFMDAYEDKKEIDAYAIENGVIYSLGIDKNNREVRTPTSFPASYWKYNCGNPFLSLKLDNIKNVKDGNFELFGEEFDEVSAFLTGWYDTVKSAKFTAKEDATYDLALLTNSKLDGDIAYTFNIKFGSEPKDIRYPRNDFSDDIEKAFKPLQGITNFTAKNVNKAAGYPDVESTLLRVDDIFFDTYDNYGYLIRGSVLYSFEYKDGVLTEPKVYGDEKDIAKFNMSFDFSGDLFKKEMKASTYSPIDSGCLSMVCQEFSYSLDRYIEYGKYTTGLSIVLDSNKNLNYFDISTSVYGFNSTNRVSFSNIGTTTLPFDPSPLYGKGETPDGIPSVYNGCYTGTTFIGDFDGSKDIRIVINDGALTINNKSITISSIEANPNGSVIISFTYNGKDYELADYNAEYPGESLQLYALDYSCMTMELSRVDEGN